MEDDFLEQQTYGQHNAFGRSVDSASHNQVIDDNIDDKLEEHSTTLF